MRVAVVMPPVVLGDPRAAVASWTTLTRTIAEVHAFSDDVEFHVFGRHGAGPEAWAANGDVYMFAGSDIALAGAVASSTPDLVHVHGLFANRLLRELGRELPRRVPVVLQHHGEPVPRLRTRWAHRVVRRRVDGYLFTGADHGQAQPFIDAGVISRKARLFEQLEAGSLLPTQHDGPAVEPHVVDSAVELAGTPSILWVGRLIEGKAPLVALDAFAAAADRLPEAHLHLLATNRTMEAEVRARIAALGTTGERVHLHDAVVHDAMPAWYAAADVYLSTSEREGSNYSLIEAMSFGCRPAVTAIPPHRAIVGDAGCVFPVGDAQAAADALVAAAALSRDDVVAQSRQRLSWPAVATSLLDTWRFLRSQPS